MQHVVFVDKYNHLVAREARKVRLEDVRVTCLGPCDLGLDGGENFSRKLREERIWREREISEWVPDFKILERIPCVYVGEGIIDGALLISDGY